MNDLGETIDSTSLESAVRECLNTIVDPCSVTAGAPAGLGDMGLVNMVRIDLGDDGRRCAVIKIGITHPFCMMAGVFLNEAQKRVVLIDGIDTVDVTLDSDTVWTPAQMSEGYQARLGQVRQARQIDEHYP